jgi:hypothetical protein
MLIDNFSQLNFCDIAFQIIDNDKDNLGQLKTLLEAAELVKKYSDHNNGTIYIFCEYLYEEIRRVEKNPKAADYTKYRKEIEQDIARVLGIKRPNSKMQDIKIIINKLDNIFLEDNLANLNDLGSKIVGCTIAAEGIEPLFVKYPILEEIAELGASLETEKDLEHQQAIFVLIKEKIDKLKDLSQV